MEERIGLARLAHAEHSAGDTESSGNGSSDADGQLLVVVVVFEVVSLPSAADEVVLDEEDAGVDGEPVCAQRKRVNNELESRKSTAGKRRDDSQERMTRRVSNALSKLL